MVEYYATTVYPGAVVEIDMKDDVLWFGEIYFPDGSVDQRAFWSNALGLKPLEEMSLDQKALLARKKL